MPATNVKRPLKNNRSVQNGSPAHIGSSEVLTLTEAAAYLRLPQDEVVRLVNTQALPGRLAGTEWRFLKSGIQDWLKTPPPKGSKEGIWALAGAWENDPYLDEMLKEIYRNRGRPMTEEG